MNVLFYVFLILNITALMLIGYDKYLAKNRKNRISEKILLTVVLIGGTIGSGLAMLIFKHKIAKKSYLITFWSIVLWQFFAVILYLNNSK